MGNETNDPQIQELRQQVASLTARVWQLEQAAGVERKIDASAPPAPLPQVQASVSQPDEPVPAPVFTTAEPSRQERLKEQYTDGSLESRIGSQIFNRVGILAVLIGMAWFLRFAIDNHWIGPLGRVLIGLLSGIGLVLWSERFRRKGYPKFSYSLKAIGSGILYLSLWAAFQMYHLIPPAVAFGGMILITAWNAFMSWAQDGELLPYTPSSADSAHHSCCLQAKITNWCSSVTCCFSM